MVETETEWDDDEREWMLALAEYESGLCPVCGNPTSYCHDPLRERDSEVEISRCMVTDLTMRALKKHVDSTGVERPEALTTRLKHKETRQ